MKRKIFSVIIILFLIHIHCTVFSLNRYSPLYQIFIGDTIGNDNSSGMLTVYEYWYDDQYSERVTGFSGSGNPFTLNMGLPTPGLPIGLHCFHLRFKDDTGKWSSVISKYFFKQPALPATGGELIAYEYWFDNEYSAKVVQSVAPQPTYILNTVLTTASLPLGLHNFHNRYKDDSDQWSSVITAVIFKIGVSPFTNNLISGYRYWFDMTNSAMVSQNLPTPVNPYQFVQNIYAGNLSIGDHWIHIQFRDVIGQWSGVVSAQFTFVGPTEQTAISSGTISNGQTNCYDALQTITVAGNGATFTIQTGGIGTMIAGEKIIYFPNTIVESGGYMLGQISPGGPFCKTPTMPAVLMENEITSTPSMVSENSSVKIYPNPTTGKFIVDLKGEIPVKFQVYVFGIRGEKLHSETLNGERKHEFSLSERTVGVYFIRVVTDGRAETVKLIRQ